MDTSRKIILSVVVLGALVLGGILFWPEAAERLESTRQASEKARTNGHLRKDWRPDEGRGGQEE